MTMLIYKCSVMCFISWKLNLFSRTHLLSRVN